MAKWLIEYDDGGWTTWSGAAIIKLEEELNGHEEVIIQIPNTSANRTLVDTNPNVRVSFDTNVIYATGTLQGVDYTQTLLTCTIYNATIEKAKKTEISGDYVSVSPATVIGAVATALGVNVDACPSTPLVTIKLERAMCFDVIKFIASATGKDYWFAADGDISIGDRGSAKGSLTNFSISKRGIDKSKKCDKAIVRGTNADGVIIWGEAGTGTSVARFVERIASDKATLDLIAAQKLAEINTDTSSVTINTTIVDVYNIYPGDTVTINKPELNLPSGSYQVRKTIKTAGSAKLEVDRPERMLENLLDKSEIDYEKLGIYTGAQAIPSEFSFQDLELLFYMDEGKGEFLNDQSLYKRMGFILGSDWIDGLAGKVLNFDGTNVVVCGIDIGGSTAFSLSFRIKPDANTGYIFYKDGAFYIQYDSYFKRVRVGIYDTGVPEWLYADSKNNSVPIGEESHIVFRIDSNENTKIFVNGVDMTATGADTTTSFNFNDNNNNLFLGGSDEYASDDYQGTLALIYMFSRYLTNAEVASLYYNGKITKKPESSKYTEINRQGLEALFFMNEGEGTKIFDESKNGHEGIIYGAEWYQGPLAKVLYFGTGDYIDCSDTIDIAGLENWAITGWTSLENYGSDQNYFIYKDDQFFIQQYGTTGKIRIGVYTGSAWQYLNSPDYLMLTGERYFIAIVCEDEQLSLFVNSTKMATVACGDPDASSENTYFGNDNSGSKALEGFMASWNIWNRMLSDEEVVGLYEYPLVQSSVNPMTFPEEYSVIADAGAAENLLLNGAFEVDRDGDGSPDYWTHENVTSQQILSSYRGKYGVNIMGTGHLTQTVPVAKNRRYRLKIRAKGANEETLSVSVCQIKLYTASLTLVTTLNCDDRDIETDYKEFVISFDTSDYSTARYAKVLLKGGTTVTESLLDSYPTGNAEAWASFHFFPCQGQTFKLTGDYEITKAKYYLTKVGSPTGTLVAKIYAHTGTFGINGKPTGTALATSTNTVDISTLPTWPSTALKDFYFDNWSSQPNVPYCLSFEVASGTIDESNHPSGANDTSSPTHEGNWFYYQSGWGYDPNYDAIFYLYGVPG